MTYKALLKKISDNVEEEVTLQVNGIDITCFAGICPYPLVLGQTYTVQFYFDDFELTPTTHMPASIERIGETYEYKIRGILQGDTLKSLIDISDDYFQTEYSYLSDQPVDVIVDRLSVEFL